MTDSSNTTNAPHVIDASGKALGRVATEAAHHLMDKHETHFARNKEGATKVLVTNAAHLRLTEKKLTQTQYQRYTGYPGGRKTLRMEEVIAKKGHRELVRTAVKGMLPKNRLQAPRLKRLTVLEEGQQ